MRRLLLLLTVAGALLTVGCKSSAPFDSSVSNVKAGSAPTCVEPESPYEEGSGHYAGYEWALNNGSGTCGKAMDRTVMIQTMTQDRQTPCRLRPVRASSPQSTSR